MAIVSSFILFGLKSVLLNKLFLLLLIICTGPLPQILAVSGETMPIKVDNLKKEFVSSVQGTDRGSRVSENDREQITKLVALLESNNPNPVMNPDLNNGTWRLVYTTFTPLFPLLATGTLPFVKIGELTEIIDSVNLVAQHTIQFIEPFALSITDHVTFTIELPNRSHVNFYEVVVQTTQIGNLANLLVLLQNVEVLGQKIDLTLFKNILSIISGKPLLKIPINANVVLVLTYLDSEFRINRLEDGSILVFIKEGSSLLTV